MALGFPLTLTHTFGTLPTTQENMEGQYNPHFIPQNTEVPQGHLFAQANKLWRLQLSWIFPDVVLSSPQVETQQQDGGSGQRALEFTGHYTFPQPYLVLLGL